MAQTTRLPPTIMIDVLLHYPAALLELDVTVTNSKIPDTTFNMYTGNEKAGENCKKPDKSAHYPVILCTLTSSYFHASIQKESWGVPKLPENW